MSGHLELVKPIENTTPFRRAFMWLGRLGRDYTPDQAAISFGRRRAGALAGAAVVVVLGGYAGHELLETDTRGEAYRQMLARCASTVTGHVVTVGLHPVSETLLVDPQEDEDVVADCQRAGGDPKVADGLYLYSE